MRFFWSRVECEAAVGSNVRSVPQQKPPRTSFIIFSGRYNACLNAHTKHTHSTDMSASVT